jgi:hypothetical protein
MPRRYLEENCGDPGSCQLRIQLREAAKKRVRCRSAAVERTVCVIFGMPGNGWWRL